MGEPGKMYCSGWNPLDYSPGYKAIPVYCQSLYKEMVILLYSDPPLDAPLGGSDPQSLRDDILHRQSDSRCPHSHHRLQPDKGMNVSKQLDIIMCRNSKLTAYDVELYMMCAVYIRPLHFALIMAS